jgi:hypothetical protein
MKILDVPQSGSVAGVTSSRNRFGQYRRTRAIPVNPNTAYQNEVRTNLSLNSLAWRVLSDSDRSAWAAYAEEHPRTDSLGQTIFLTGFQMFVGINNTKRLLGIAPTTLPPAEPEELEITIGAMTCAAGVAEVNITGIVVVNNVLVYSSPPKSAGVNFNRDYRFIGVLPAKAAAPAADVDITTLFTTKWGGTPPEGGKFFVRFIQQVSGVTFAPVDRTFIWLN